MSNIHGKVHKCADCERVFLTLLENATYCPYCASETLLVNMEEDYASEVLDKISQRMNPIKLAQ